MDLIKVAEEAFATGKQHPDFKAGDTVTVAYKIIEGNKERIQLYRGVVIKICGHGEKKRFTVRKMSGTIGVDRESEHREHRGEQGWSCTSRQAVLPAQAHW